MLLIDVVLGVVYGDLLMRCLYRVRPYERVPGSANALHAMWQKKCIAALNDKHSTRHYRRICHQIVEDFDTFPIDETLVKPRVGVGGESLGK